MDQIIDRLVNLFKTVFSEDPFKSSEYGETRKRYYDPDLKEAWEELDDFLNYGTSSTQSKGSYQDQKTYESTTQEDTEHLRMDYTNLEVPFGSQFSIVKKSYKSLLRKYHPDRHANNPKKLKIATEITKKINISFQRIKEFENKRI